MNYLVLGGSGFIGSHIVDKLLAEGHNVSVLDAFNERYRSPLIDVKYFIGYFGDTELLKKALQGQDIVIHSISTTVPETSNHDMLNDVESNLYPSLTLFKIASEQGVKRMVFLSSGGAVYGNPKIVPIPENHPKNPISSYGITKLAIEKYLALYSHLSGMEYNIIRPSNPYGPRQNPFGAQGIISVYLGKILKGEPIEIWGDGLVYRDYIYIDDLISAIYNVSISQVKSKIFNIGSGEAVSILEIVKKIKKVLDKDFDIKFLDGRDCDVSKVCLDISLASASLDFSPNVSLDEGILKTWEFVNNLPTH